MVCAPPKALGRLGQAFGEILTGQDKVCGGTLSSAYVDAPRPQEYRPSTRVTTEILGRATTATVASPD